MSLVGAAGSIVDLVPVPTAHTAVVAVADEAILVDERRGHLHLLNSSGTLVWSLLDGVSSVGDICADLADVVGIPADIVAADVGRLVRRLLDDDLVVASGYQRAPLPDELGVCNCGEAHGPQDIDRIEIAGNP